MALLGRVVGTTLLIGGAALTVAAVAAAPGILRASRPFAREAIRRGLEFYDHLRAAAAEFTDDVEDLVAEVRADPTARRPANDGQVKAAKRA